MLNPYEKRLTYAAIGILLAACLVGWWLRGCAGVSAVSSYLGPGSAPEIIYKTQTLTVRDTVVVERPRTVVRVVQAPATVRVDTLRDTVIQSPPFTATLDTIIQRDTIGAAYHFPEHRFDVTLRPRPDSIIVRTMVINTESIRRDSWWQTASWIGLGLATGLVTGYVTGATNN